MQPISYTRQPGTLSLLALVALGMTSAGAVDAADSPEAPKPGVPSPAHPSSPSKSASAAEKPDKGLKKLLRAKEGNVDELLQAIRALPADKRQQLRENLRTWQNLSDGQRQQLRERETVLRKKAAEELSACLPNAKLSGEDSEALQKRYIEERRKLETNLRAEMDARRKAEVERLTEKFREELRLKTAGSEPN